MRFRRTSRPLSSAFASLFLLTLWQCALPAERAEDSTTEILWDSWGVPHVFAPDRESLYFAYGWAQAKSHADLLLKLIGEARGRAAEYWGEDYLESDRWILTMGIPDRSVRWTEAQKPEYRGMLDAFARGINAYVENYREAVADDVEVVLPVRAEDLLAHFQRVMHFTFVVSPESVSGTKQRWGEMGSNTWAIGPKRSASGHSILLANPHLPWDGVYVWHEAHLVSPEVNVSGASLVGMPFLAIAFNDDLGWSHTVNTHDGADLYELTLAEGGYVFDDEVRAFEEAVHKLKVRGADGALREEELVVRRSVHGPIVAEKEGRALALRVVGLEAPHALEQYWKMATAKNLKEFEAAQSMLQMPMFTTMYADADGHIMHWFGGLTPVRSKGDWEEWSGIVPGNDSANLWTSAHSYEELPRVVDPESGWLQNANDPPWTTTFPAAIRADDYPAYMAPREMSFRPQRSARMLLEDDSMSFEEVLAAKHSTRMEMADRLLDDIALAVEAHPNEVARRALDVLQKWDRSADAVSRGAVLFARFARQLGAESFDVPWSEQDPTVTPDGLADPGKAVELLAAVATEVEEDHGALDVPWGEVYRLRRGEHEMPSNGGPGGLGIFRVVWYARDGENQYRATGGDGYVAVVEFSDPVRAEVLLGYGNSSQVDSPHNGDQLELFSQKKLRPAWRSRRDIEANLEEREELSEER